MNLNTSIDKYFESKTEYKNERAELIGEAVKHINYLREGTVYKPETARNLAIRINMNPFLSGKKNNDTLRWVLNKCKEKGRYTGLYWLLDNKKSK
jgi:hypothetical protein